MGFVMDGLAAEGYDRSYSDRQLLGRIVRYFRPFLPTMAVVSGAISGAAVLDAALPVLVATGIDRLAVDGAAEVASPEPGFSSPAPAGSCSPSCSPAGCRGPSTSCASG